MLVAGSGREEWAGQVGAVRCGGTKQARGQEPGAVGEHRKGRDSGAREEAGAGGAVRPLRAGEQGQRAAGSQHTQSTLLTYPSAASSARQ